MAGQRDNPWTMEDEGTNLVPITPAEGALGNGREHFAARSPGCCAAPSFCQPYTGTGSSVHQPYTGTAPTFDESLLDDAVFDYNVEHYYAFPDDVTSSTDVAAMYSPLNGIALGNYAIGNDALPFYPLQSVSSSMDNDGPYYSSPATLTPAGYSGLAASSTLPVDNSLFPYAQIGGPGQPQHVPTGGTTPMIAGQSSTTCPICRTEVSRPTDLPRHMRIHDPAARIYKCTVAGCGFRPVYRKDKLTAHEKNRHPELAHGGL